MSTKKPKKPSIHSQVIEKFKEKILPNVRKVKDDETGEFKKVDLVLNDAALKRALRTIRIYNNLKKQIRIKDNPNRYDKNKKVGQFLVQEIKKFFYDNNPDCHWPSVYGYFRKQAKGKIQVIEDDKKNVIDVRFKDNFSFIRPSSLIIEKWRERKKEIKEESKNKKVPKKQKKKKKKTDPYI